MKRDNTSLTQTASVGASLRARDPLGPWKARAVVEKYWAPRRPGDQPYEVVENVGNLVLNGGADIIWERLLTKNPTTVSSTARSAYSTESVIGVSTNASTSTYGMSALQGTTKWYSSMEAGYPAHTTGGTTASREVDFRSVFSSSEANIAWNEWGVFNSTAAAGRMLQRKGAASLGTKTSAATWTFTATLTLN